MLDPDEFDHLPDIVHIPIEGADPASKQAIVSLRELVNGGTALLVYSSRELLVAGCGPDCASMAVSTSALPGFQRRLRFTAVLLDVSLPSGSPQPLPTEDRQPRPTTVDPTTGEPLIYVASRPFRRGDTEAGIELQPLANGQRALLAYSTAQSLLAGCGPEQYFVRFPASRLPEVVRQCGADQVLIDSTLPERLRHRPNGGMSHGR